MSHSTLRAKRAMSTFGVNKKITKNAKNGKKGKLEACGQKVLPDRSVTIGQKLAENTKIQKFKCDIFE